MWIDKMKKTCVGCYAYEDDPYMGRCSLGYTVTQLFNPLALNPENKETHHCGRIAGGGGDHYSHKCKPAENCPKPMTIKQLIRARL